MHHVTAREDRREEIFRNDRDRSKFLGYLSEGAERYKVKVHCYVLMENHFHLVATTPDGKLSKCVEQVLARVSQHFQCDLERLKERSIGNNLARRCAITLCRDHAGLSHNEIVGVTAVQDKSNLDRLALYSSALVALSMAS